MKFTGERYLPDVEAPEISYEHWHRYLFASQYAKGKSVLDLGCGEGYGSQYLSMSAKRVVGVDISQESIQHATEKYVKKNLEFKIGPVSKIPIKKMLFDVVVAFEIIEHISEPDQKLLIAEVKRLLKPTGVFLVSTPNKLIYSDLPGYKNEYHIKEFYISEFQELLKSEFKYTDLLGQKVEMGSYISGVGGNQNRNLTEYRLNFTNLGFRPTEAQRDFLYFLAVCSNKPLKKASSSIAIDVSYKMLVDRDKLLLEKNQSIIEKEKLLTEKNELLTEREDLLLEKNKLVKEKEKLLIERDSKIIDLKSQIVEAEKTAQALNIRITDMEQTIQALNIRVTDLEQTNKATRSLLLEKEYALGEKLASLKENTIKLQEYVSWVAHLDDEINRLKWELAEINRSLGWQLILWLRKIKDQLAPPGGTLARLFRLIRRAIIVWREDGFRSMVSRTWKKLRSRLTNNRPPSLNSAISYGISSSQTLPILQEAIPESGGSVYVSITESDFSISPAQVKPIAFYLPQFHPIPENDLWWGKGFTEWTNVTKAVPNFKGHIQPRVPGELGYYDLRIPAVQERQIELAKKYGIYGFCYYYYWFHGKRLLELPLDQFLANPKWDFPFCVCWANENWTRRWDGGEKDVLIGQRYSAEDYLAFIHDLIPILKDDRYIRVDGKPLVSVYRASLLHDPRHAAEIWRNECQKLGIGEIYLAAIQSFGITDPRPFNFDAAIEFPPHYLGGAEVDPKGLLFTNPDFSGRIFDYRVAAQLMMQKPVPEFPLYKTVMPSWDNTARMQDKSHIFINSSPAVYQDWLTQAVKYSVQNLPTQNRFVFINAWNEWAEGNYLEPDGLYGYSYLQSTREAISSSENGFSKLPVGWTILFVSHDAYKGGAQQALLNTVSWFKKHTALNVKILCLAGGDDLHKFKQLADTKLLSEFQQPGEDNKWVDRILEFCGGRLDLIYGNSVVAGKIYPALALLGAPIVTHVHELDMGIRFYGNEWMGAVQKYSVHYLTCSKKVKENLVGHYHINPGIISIGRASVFSNPAHGNLSSKEKEDLKIKLGLDQGRHLIMGCGLGMPFRKGADLFIELGRELRKSGRNDFHLYWLGAFDESSRDEHQGNWSEYLRQLDQSDLHDFVTFLGYKEDPSNYLQLADVYVLTSREEPFGLVALEAADCGVPTICFENAGAMDFIGEDAGFGVAVGDLEAMGKKVISLMDDETLRHELGERAREKFRTVFSADRTTYQIMSVCRRVAGKKPALSVIVPNYNHAQYLTQRLESIFTQTYRDFELIILDDASSDDSLKIVDKYADLGDIQIIRGETNSGSPFKQWLKGLKLARADILWVAESDDRSDPKFLESLLPAFRDTSVKLAYANSHIINEKDEIVGDYINSDYLTSLSRTKWKSSYQVPAEQEINEALGIKDTILNISAVLFRKFELDSIFYNTLESMRTSGDWFFIVNAIKEGMVYYDVGKFNYHRRHSESVIGKLLSSNRVADYYKEMALVHEAVADNYRLTSSFYQKWREYLRQQWDQFYPGRPFEDLKDYYPLDEIDRLIKTRLK